MTHHALRLSLRAPQAATRLPQR